LAKTAFTFTDDELGKLIKTDAYKEIERDD